MSVFQRRLASLTYALMRWFERRLGRLDEAIELEITVTSQSAGKRAQMPSLRPMYATTIRWLSPSSRK